MVVNSWFTDELMVMLDVDALMVECGQLLSEPMIGVVTCDGNRGRAAG